MHESTWSGPLPQAAVVVFCLPRTSESLSLIALHGRKHRYVGRKVGGMLDALGCSPWSGEESIVKS